MKRRIRILPSRTRLKTSRRRSNLAHQKAQNEARTLNGIKSSSITEEP